MAGWPGESSCRALPRRSFPKWSARTVATIAPAELKALLDAARLRSSISRRASLMKPGTSPAPGLRCARGSPDSLERVPRRRFLVLTSPDGRLARARCGRTGGSGGADIRVLAGGTNAWRAAGLPLATGREAMADTPNDCWRRPYDPYAGAGARERYLRWEIELVHQIEREGDVGFRIPG